MSTPDAGIAELRERVLAAAAGGSAAAPEGRGHQGLLRRGSGRGRARAALPTAASSSYEPSELVIRARAGTPLSQIEAALAAEGQFLAFEPPAFGGDPTLGGVIAAGLSGPRRVYAGAARDFVLGTRLLTADGELLRFGGEVMKNVAGFDVSRLLCGSLGILGTDHGGLPEGAAAAARRGHRAPRVRRPRGARGLQPLGRAAAAALGGRLERRAVPGCGSRARRRRFAWPVNASAASRWTRRRPGSSGMACATVLYLSSDNSRCGASRCPPPRPSPQLGSEPLIDWGGAVRWYGGVPQATDVRAAAVASGGTALCWRGPVPRGQRFHPLSGVTLELHRRLKQRFDPRGIFNPNRLVDGL